MIKNRVILILSAAIILCVSSFGILFKKYTSTLLEKNRAVLNIKAYKQELIEDSLNDRIFIQTLQELKSQKDSITNVMLKYQKQLNIKDKNLTSVLYIHEHIVSTDTVFLKDTVFVKGVSIDTTLNNSYYKIRLLLKYPASVSVSPEFNNEKIVYMSLRKETINPPKKCWILRLFQKKQKVGIVDIVDTNPYVQTDKLRYIQILK